MSLLDPSSWFSGGDGGSWWDPITNYFTGGSGGGTSALTNGLSDVVDQAPTSTGSLAGDFGSNVAQLGASTYGGAGGLSSGGYATPGLDFGSTGSSMPTDTGALGTAANSATDARGGYGEYATPATVGGDLTSGLSSGLQKAGKYALAHPTQMAGLLNNLTTSNKVPQAYQSAVDTQSAGNASNAATSAAKTAVGNSMISQAPYLANNAYAGSMNSNAANEAATKLHLNQMGYHEGDPMYDSMIAAGRTTASQNNGTAWAQGQGQRATQEAQGAGLLTPYTPKTDAYTQLGNAQNTQQQNQNKSNTDLYGTALDIYANS